MKAYIKFFMLTAISLSLLSCARQIPVLRTTPGNNSTYKVDFLFEHDGCKIYRFRDAGNYVYFSNCKGEMTSVSSDSTLTHTLNSVNNESIK